MVTRFSIMLPLLYLVINCDILEARMRKTPNIQGIIAPAYTPYKCNTSELDLSKVDPMAKYYADKGVDGVLVAGKTGEGYMLTEDECKLLYKAWVKAARFYGLFVIVLVGDPTPTGIRLAIYAESIGVDAISILLPLFYQPMTAKAALADIKLFTDRVKYTPIILYVDPMSKPDCLRIDELYCLANKIHNFAGLRCSMETAMQIRAAGLYKPHQYLLISNHYAIQAVFCMGFNGSMAVANSLAPEMAVAIKNAESWDEAREYQQKINRIIRAIAPSPRNYIQSSKAAFFIITGIDPGNTRAPLEPFTCADQKRITRNLRREGVYLNNPVESCYECDSQNQNSFNSDY